MGLSCHKLLGFRAPFVLSLEGPHGDSCSFLLPPKSQGIMQSKAFTMSTLSCLVTSHVGKYWWLKLAFLLKYWELFSDQQQQVGTGVSQDPDWIPVNAEWVSMWGARPMPGGYSFTVSWSTFGISPWLCSLCMTGSTASGIFWAAFPTLLVCRECN